MWFLLKQVFVYGFKPMNWLVERLHHYWHHYLRYMLRHWFPLVLIGVVWAFIWGKIGANFGVPLLFRDDPAYSYQLLGWSWDRPSIAGFTAATVLLMAFLTIVYIFEFAGNTKRPAIVLPTAIRRFLEAVRAPELLIQFASSASAPIRFFAIAGVVPICLLLAAAAVPSFELADGAPECTERNTFCKSSDISENSAPSAAADHATSDDDQAAPRTWAFHLDELMKAFAGVVIGIAISMTCGLFVYLNGWMATSLARQTGRLAPGLRVRLQPLFKFLRTAISGKAREQSLMVVGTILTVVFLFLTSLALAFTNISLAAMARPGATICIFFGVVVAFYFFVLVLSPSMRFFGVIAFFAMHAWVGADRYINELPGVRVTSVDAVNGEPATLRTNYYKCLLRLDESGHPVKSERLRDCDPTATEDITDSLDPKEVNDRKTPPLLTAKAWTDQWRSATPEEPSKKLVVVATQGGAYRASFWTSLILDELDLKGRKGELAHVTDRIGLLTGASGGMVASAYFTVMGSKEMPLNDQAEHHGCSMNPRGNERTWKFGPVTSQLCLDVYSAAHPDNTSSKFTTPRAIARDSLTPVAAQTVLFDMRRVLFWPLTAIPGFDLLDWNDQTRHDRGLILERQWGTLHKSYGELARLQHERRQNGERHPSMIISPMIADTGQPLLISNLDLEKLVNNGSNEAVSMFDWFPDIRNDFRVQTAVRMNASFPYISPAVSLPTTIRRRVVDAGYYDNYGVNTAIAWLFQEEVLEFLADPNAGIDGLIIIQIRAFEGRDQGQPVQPEDAATYKKEAETPESEISHKKKKHKPDIPLIPEWLTSPLAGVLSARSGSMTYRNDAQIERLRRVLVAEDRPEDFVQTVIFENHADTDQVGVSWHITPSELARLERELKSKENKNAFACLVGFWHDLFDENDCPENAEEMLRERRPSPATTRFRSAERQN